MFSTHFSNGSSHTERESRLCAFSPAFFPDQNQNPIGNFLGKAGDVAKDASNFVFNPGAITSQNYANLQEFIRALQTVNFNAPAVPLQGRTQNWTQYIASLDNPARTKMYADSVNVLFPAEMRQRTLGTTEINNETQQVINRALSIIGNGGPSGSYFTSTESPSFPGQEASQFGQDQASVMAREALGNIFHPGALGVYYESLRKAIHAPGAPQLIDPNQLGDVNFVKTLGDPIGAAAKMGALDEKTLGLVANIAQKREAEADKSHMQAKVKLLDMDPSMQDFTTRIERNINRLTPNMRVGLALGGAYMAWSLWNRPGRLFGIIPYWAIVAGGATWYGYEAVVNGTRKPGTKMIADIVTFGAMLANHGRDLYRYARRLPSRDRREFDRTGLAVQVLRERGHLGNIETTAAVMSIIGDFPFQTISGSLLETGNVWSLNLQDSSPFMQRLNLFFQRENFTMEQRNNVMNHLQNPTINNSVATAMLHLCYKIGARQPLYQAKAKRIEDARVQLGINAPYEALASYNPQLWQDYLDIARHGMRHVPPRITLMEVMDGVVREQAGEAPGNVDNAQRFNPETIATTTDERALYNTMRTLALTRVGDENNEAALKRSRELLRTATKTYLTQFLNNCQQHYGLLADGCRDIVLREFDNMIRGNISGTELLIKTERLRYALLVAASSRREPLSTQQVEELMRALDQGGFLSAMQGVWDWFNRNAITISNDFPREVGVLNDVRRIVQSNYVQRLFGPNVNAESKILQDRIILYQNRIAEINAQTVGKRLLDNMTQEQRNRLGGNERAGRLLTDLLSLQNFTRMRDDGERLLSIRLANEVSIAASTAHGVNGIHRRDPVSRITKIEVQNLLDVFDYHFRNTFLDPNSLTNLTSGGFAMVHLNELLLNTAEPTAEDMNDATKRTAALDRAKDLGMIFLVLKTAPTQDEPTMNQIKQRVKDIARNLMQHYQTMVGASFIGDVETMDDVHSALVRLLRLSRRTESRVANTPDRDSAEHRDLERLNEIIVLMNLSIYTINGQLLSDGKVSAKDAKIIGKDGSVIAKDGSVSAKDGKISSGDSKIPGKDSSISPDDTKVPDKDSGVPKGDAGKGSVPSEDAKTPAKDGKASGIDSKIPVDDAKKGSKDLKVETKKPPAAKKPIAP